MVDGEETGAEMVGRWAIIKAGYNIGMWSGNAGAISMGRYNGAITIQAGIGRGV